MVTYLESSATATVTVITDEVATTLTLTVPTADIVQGVSFRMSGELRRADNDQILPGQSIIAEYTLNNIVYELGSDITAGDGSYNIDGFIFDVGTYTITAKFNETTTDTGITLGASNALATIRMGLSLNAPLAIAATAVLGAILMAFGLSK